MEPRSLVTRRRFLACAATAAGGALLAPRSLSALAFGRAPITVLRVGLLVPAGSPASARSAADGVRMGVDEAARTATLFGRGVELVQPASTSPDPAAQARALVDAGAHVLLSALSDDATAAAAVVADERRVSLLNLTAAGDELRGAGCRRFLFHVAPSDAMRADAGVRWLTSTRKPPAATLMVDHDPARTRTTERVEAALRAAGAEVGRMTLTPKANGDVDVAIDGLPASGAAVVLADPRTAAGLAANWNGGGWPLVDLAEPWPDAPAKEGPGQVVRPAAWHPALERFGADQLNERFTRRFGRKMDEAAWAGWFAVKAAADGAMRSNATDAAALAAYLGGGRAEVDGQKGWPLSFRPWDHQLRQPLYLVEIGRNASDGRVVGEVPGGERGEGDSAAALDLLGAGAADGGCHVGQP